MADRPILFSAPMVRALLGGRKTQTRRIFKGAEQNENGLWHVYGSGGGVIGVAEENVGREAVDYLPIHVGDRLWVRETWSGHCVFRETPPAQRISFITPDGPYFREDVWYWADGEPTCGDYERPRPGIHMPRWASRITLYVTEVRVERLQDISRDDVLAEGIRRIDGPVTHFAVEDGGFYAPLPKLAFRYLWDSINDDPKRPGCSWRDNPWVAAYSFTVDRKNIDEVSA